MTHNREAAMNRIRALLAKTTANGATEAEALTAAAKAGELLDRYNLTLSDVEIKQERCEQRQATERRHEVDRVVTAIARFTGTKVWNTAGRIQFFGLPHDVDVAVYLTDLIRTAMDSSYKRFLRSPERPLNVKTYRLRKSFMFGMTNRLNARLNEMSAAREAQAKTSSGTALVVVRNAVVTEQFAKLNLGLRAPRKRKTRIDNQSFGAGKAAGDRVNITSGISQSGQRMIA